MTAPSPPEGRLFFHMTAAFDEFQRELTVENTRAGLKAVARHGRRGGRPKAMNERTLKHARAMLASVKAGQTKPHGRTARPLASAPRAAIIAPCIRLAGGSS